MLQIHHCPCMRGRQTAWQRGKEGGMNESSCEKRSAPSCQAAMHLNLRRTALSNIPTRRKRQRIKTTQVNQKGKPSGEYKQINRRLKVSGGPAGQRVHHRGPGLPESPSARRPMPTLNKEQEEKLAGGLCSHRHWPIAHLSGRMGSSLPQGATHFTALPSPLLLKHTFP